MPASEATNASRKAVSLSGWTVKDVAKHTYKLSGTLAAGASVTVHTGKGTTTQPTTPPLRTTPPSPTAPTTMPPVITEPTAEPVPTDPTIG